MSPLENNTQFHKQEKLSGSAVNVIFDGDSIEPQRFKNQTFDLEKKTNSFLEEREWRKLMKYFRKMVLRKTDGGLKHVVLHG